MNVVWEKSVVEGELDDGIGADLRLLLKVWEREEEVTFRAIHFRKTSTTGMCI